MNNLKISKIIFLVVLFFVCFGCATVSPRKSVEVEKIYGISRTEVAYRVAEYLKNNPHLDERIKVSLLELKLVTGMNKEQVMMLAGKPDKIMDQNDSEVWFYDLGWSGLWGSAEKYRLTFREGIVTNIDLWFLESL